MLAPEDNEALTRIGPGTVMGTLFRRFWLPALLESELAGCDGPPVRLRLLGEDLVAFRDNDGRVGIIDAYCAHRRAHLFFGRNESGGLRCVYHGWQYAVDGRCIDMPSEPPASAFSDKIRLRAYPNRSRGGVIWVYMGPADRIAEPPDFEWSRLPAPQRAATKRLQACNWAQAVEGGIDSSHISFLHSSQAAPPRGFEHATNRQFHTADRHPVFDVAETPYGLSIAARRDADASHYYWRITQFLLPCYTMIPPVGAFTDSSAAPYDGHAWVPIDDDTTWTWSFGAQPHRPYTAEEYAFRAGPDGLWGPIDDAYRPLLNRANDYGIDRERQRRANFTGIEGIPNQDAAVQESMGPIVDRSRERLGTSDRAIVQFRRLLLRVARDLASGSEPAAAGHGLWYNVRPASVLLDRGTPIAEGASRLLRGLDPTVATGEKVR